MPVQATALGTVAVAKQVITETEAAVTTVMAEGKMHSANHQLFGLAMGICFRQYHHFI